MSGRNRDLHTDLVSRLARTSHPAIAEPNIWNATYSTHLGNVVKRPKNAAIVIIGFKWAPETGPIVNVNTGSMKTTIRLPINVGTTGPVSRFLFSRSVNIAMQRQNCQMAHPIFSDSPTAKRIVRYTSKHVPNPSTTAAFHNSICKNCFRDKVSLSGTHGAASGIFSNSSLSVQWLRERENSWFAPRRPANGVGALAEGTVSLSLRQKLA